MGFLSNLFKPKPKPKVGFPPVPQWRPNTPISHSQIMDAAKYYTGNNLQIAVFKYGTVVYFPETVADVEKEAKSTLDKIYHWPPDFTPLTQEDGNYLIEYSQPAFTIVFKDDLERYWEYIENNHQSGICKDEILRNSKGEHNVFDRIGKICLFGRAKMFMDAQNPQVVKMFTP